MTIAIIDDSKSDRELLYTMLETFFSKYDFQTSISLFSSAETFLESFEPEQFDLCFMDIFMGEINGMEAARRIYEADKNCIIIFLSSSDQYMGEGYRVRAMRYLLKPITELQLNEILPECIELSELGKRRLTITLGRRDREIPFSKILYVISADRPEIHLQDCYFTLTSRQTFSETTAPLLEDYRFLTCSRGIVVNMAHAKRIDRNCFVMDNGDRIPISRRQFSPVNDRFIDFQFEYFL